MNIQTRPDPAKLVPSGFPGMCGGRNGFGHGFPAGALVLQN